MNSIYFSIFSKVKLKKKEMKKGVNWQLWFLCMQTYCYNENLTESEKRELR
jgi:hypothetical protein